MEPVTLNLINSDRSGRNYAMTLTTKGCYAQLPDVMLQFQNRTKNKQAREHIPDCNQILMFSVNGTYGFDECSQVQKYQVVSSTVSVLNHSFL